MELKQIPEWPARQNDSEMRKCRGPCQQVLDVNEFDVDKDKVSGRKAWCKACRARKKAANNISDAEQIVASIDGTVLAQLKQASVGGTMLPHQIQALEAIMQLIGGVDGYAMLWAQTFTAAPPGSQTRERMLANLHKAIQACSDDGKVSKPRELMSDDELQASIDEKMKRLGLRTVDANDVRESA